MKIYHTDSLYIVNIKGKNFICEKNRNNEYIEIFTNKRITNINNALKYNEYFYKKNTNNDLVSLMISEEDLLLKILQNSKESYKRINNILTPEEKIYITSLIENETYNNNQSYINKNLKDYKTLRLEKHNK